ncbi:hypothetical protein AALP_AA4G074900 [Arabis alpina]|uniref:Uncharacterized protein n=1 Tax=Arabis alpina TaxID=50452 RepID=A0A087H1S8_ARAAL|nr:hypothetical protein AALP_AA4G074900 [Arabis alpina]
MERTFSAAVKRNPGRPKRSSAATQVTATTLAPAAKRGRKPNTGVVAKKPVGRPRKVTSLAAKPTTGRHGAANARALKRKTALLQKKVKEAIDKLNAALKQMEEVQGSFADILV